MPIHLNNEMFDYQRLEDKELIDDHASKLLTYRQLEKALTSYETIMQAVSFNLASEKIKKNILEHYKAKLFKKIDFQLKNPKLMSKDSLEHSVQSLKNVLKTYPTLIKKNEYQLQLLKLGSQLEDLKKSKIDPDIGEEEQQAIVQHAHQQHHELLSWFKTNLNSLNTIRVNNLFPMTLEDVVIQNHYLREFDRNMGKGTSAINPFINFSNLVLELIDIYYEKITNPNSKVDYDLMLEKHFRSIVSSLSWLGSNLTSGYLTQNPNLQDLVAGISFFIEILISYANILIVQSRQHKMEQELLAISQTLLQPKGFRSQDVKNYLLRKCNPKFPAFSTLDKTTFTELSTALEDESLLNGANLDNFLEIELTQEQFETILEKLKNHQHLIDKLTQFEHTLKHRTFKPFKNLELDKLESVKLHNLKRKLNFSAEFNEDSQWTKLEYEALIEKLLESDKDLAEKLKKSQAYLDELKLEEDIAHLVELQTQLQQQHAQEQKYLYFGLYLSIVFFISFSVLTGFYGILDIDPASNIQNYMLLAGAISSTALQILGTVIDNNERVEKETNPNAIYALRVNLITNVFSQFLFPSLSMTTNLLIRPALNVALSNTFVLLALLFITKTLVDLIKSMNLYYQLKLTHEVSKEDEILLSQHKKDFIELHHNYQQLLISNPESHNLHAIESKLEDTKQQYLEAFQQVYAKEISWHTVEINQLKSFAMIELMLGIASVNFAPLIPAVSSALGFDPTLYVAIFIFISIHWWINKHEAYTPELTEPLAIPQQKA